MTRCGAGEGSEREVSLLFFSPSFVLDGRMVGLSHLSIGQSVSQSYPHYTPHGHGHGHGQCRLHDMMHALPDSLLKPRLRQPLDSPWINLHTLQSSMGDVVLPQAEARDLEDMEFPWSALL
jgi:hypothetical protein